MLLRKESLPKANIYSSKILFDQMEDRNKKRISQILRRKKALSTRNKTKIFEEEKLDSPKKEKDEININTFNQFNKSIYNFNNLNENSPKKSYIKNSINDINYNNSTNHNSSILNKDSQEKEINISNIEGNTTEILIPNKNQKINETNINSNINQENKSIINVDIIDNFDENFNDENKENDYLDSNEFAIKYLSSSLKSFIKLDNHLVSKVKFQNNCFTDSYSQALELHYENNFTNNNYFKSLLSKSYLVTEIIKEEKEKEGETPLKINKKISKNKYKNNLNENNEENEINRRMAKRRAYSKRIRNNALNKNLNNEFGNIKKNNDKTLCVSKSCKKLKKFDNLDLTNGNSCGGCIYRNVNIKKNCPKIDDINNNNFGRKTLCNFKKRNNLNNSLIIINKNDKNNKNICNLRKTITAINSSKNLIKNEKIIHKLGNSRSNLNIFKTNITQKNENNLNNLNISMNNSNTKFTEKNKMRKSKSTKKMNTISNNTYLNHKQYQTINYNNQKIHNNNIINNNRILRKNPTMGKLTFIKKINVGEKENSKIQKNNNQNNANKIILKKYNKEKSFLFNTMSSKNIKIRTNGINNINTRNSMPIKQKTNKIIKNILNNKNNKSTKNLILNKSFCYLNKKDK